MQCKNRKFYSSNTAVVVTAANLLCCLPWTSEINFRWSADEREKTANKYKMKTEFIRFFFVAWFFYFIKKCRLIYYHKTNSDNSGTHTRHWTISVAREQQIVTSRKMAKPAEKRSIPGMCDEKHTYLLSKRLHCKFSVLIFPLDISFHSMRARSHKTHESRAHASAFAREKSFFSLSTAVAQRARISVSAHIMGSRRMIATGRPQASREIYLPFCLLFALYATHDITNCRIHCAYGQIGICWRCSSRCFCCMHSISSARKSVFFLSFFCNILCNRGIDIDSSRVAQKPHWNYSIFPSHKRRD